MKKYLNPGKLESWERDPDIANRCNQVNFTQDSSWSLDKLALGRNLGRGTFGSIILVRNKKTKCIAADKIIWKDEIESGNIPATMIESEIQIHKGLLHPNILQLFGSFTDKIGQHILLEYAPYGDLEGELTNQKNESFCEDVAIDYFCQMATALKFCHDKNVMHRDVKPSNMLIGWSRLLKLADFGWSSEIRTNNELRHSTYCGTPLYMAPEKVLNAPSRHAPIAPVVYDEQVDVWSLGVCLFQMLYGRFPFTGDNDSTDDKELTKKTLEAILGSPLVFPPEPTVTTETIQLLRFLLAKNVALRPRLADVMGSAWWKKWAA